MKRLGIDLSQLVENANIDPNVTMTQLCPGASLRLTRADFDDLLSRGETFSSDRKDIPADGLGEARVHCDDACAEIPEPTAAHKQFYGLCRYCAELEADNRRILHERAASMPSRNGTVHDLNARRRVV